MMLKYRAIIGLTKQINKLVKIPFPELHQGPGSINKVNGILERQGIKKPLIVTDGVLVSLGMVDKLAATFTEERREYVIFDKVSPDPSVQTVEDGFAVYQANGCDGIIALGGGSPQDCAKVIGAKVARNIEIRAMAGQLKIRKTLPNIIAIPTTAGTGSEATIAAVISDVNEKFAIIDPALVPKTAILDPELMLGLPATISAATGMDALTHAIEAYLGGYSNNLTDGYAQAAITTIFESLPKVFENGEDLAARESMALASYQAGCAFTRAFVGYVHAISHQLGAIYHIPHGLANAVLLPYVLKFNLPSCETRLQQLADLIGVKDGAAFIDEVVKLNKQLNIPTSFEQLKKSDIPEIARRALKEAHGTYPVPRYMNQLQCEQLIAEVLPE